MDTRSCVCVAEEAKVFLDLSFIGILKALDIRRIPCPIKVKEHCQAAGLDGVGFPFSLLYFLSRFS